MSEKLVREWKKVFVGDLGYIAHELKETVKPKALIFLDAPMGAGKTTFAKRFISDDETFSPSYAVLSETHSVLHADFYRLKAAEEIYHLELPLYLEDKSYFLVEWGRPYLNTLLKELPEDFEVFSMKIHVNSETQKEDDDKASFSRNFSLYKINDL
ncbi:MAG: tRNA (adenosine(37)-N6)-threonylcarbamoyltransferase complex ATPase subunit type 1 TsaE [Bacteriovoracaceae bacterium]|nr:tRNA (adenosine(37)-N6)-threonylcarbamoyltransferase complex ATPase subunit type 1 TsaE [Bacteriovoracaceae bacterium]